MPTPRNRFLNAVWQYFRDRVLEDHEIVIARLMLASLDIGDNCPTLTEPKLRGL